MMQLGWRCSLKFRSCRFTAGELNSTLRFSARLNILIIESMKPC